MRTPLTLALLAALTLGCTGGHDTPPPPDDPGGGGGTVTQPVAPAVFVGRPRATMQPGGAPLGTMPDTFIVAPDGLCRFELQGWNHGRIGLFVAPDGSLSIPGDSTMTDQTGATVPLTNFTGTLANGRLTGQANGLEFDLEVTTILDTANPLPSYYGTYRATDSSNGLIAVLTIEARLNEPSTVGRVHGEAYLTQEDALARVNSQGTYEGSISEISPGKNVWNFGVGYWPRNAASLPQTYGLCYFTETGLVALTANHLRPEGGQYSAVFVKE